MSECNCDYTPPEIRPCMNCRRVAIEKADQLMSEPVLGLNATGIVVACKHCKRRGFRTASVPPQGWTFIGGVIVCDDPACNLKELEVIGARRANDAAIADAATAFVMAHCELDALARSIGAEAACNHPINDRVIDLHLELERAVLGDLDVLGRRSR